MAKKIKEKICTLENYDGYKGYFGSVRYIVYDSANVGKIASADPGELAGLESCLDNDKMIDNFPFLKILDENYGYEQALVRRLSSREEQLLVKEFDDIDKVENRNAKLRIYSP